jgi:transcriptional regulator
MLAVFQGPAAYVRNRWYCDPGLPTYNFVVAHLLGRPASFDEPSEVLAHLAELVDLHERRYADAWRLPASPDPYVDQLLPEIAAFRFPVERIEAKLKINQNRSAADRAEVIRGLEASGGESGLAVAELMQGYGFESDQAEPLLTPPAPRPPDK